MCKWMRGRTPRRLLPKRRNCAACSLPGHLASQSPLRLRGVVVKLNAYCIAIAVTAISDSIQQSFN
jgi:hypothetical protein